MRTETGYTLAIKAYNEGVDPKPFLNEVKIFEHLQNLQGICIPVVVGSGESIFAGTIRGIIIMSYEGIGAATFELTETVLERIGGAFSAIHANRVYHQDITLRNILINEDKVSVIDFESAAICDREAPFLEGEQEVVERACARVRLSRDNDRFLDAY